MSGIVCGPRLYEFKDWFFEYHRYCGPWPLNKDGELRKKAGKKFWNIIKEFDLLSDTEREKFRVGGGCVRND